MDRSAIKLIKMLSQYHRYFPNVYLLNLFQDSVDFFDKKNSLFIRSHPIRFVNKFQLFTLIIIILESVVLFTRVYSFFFHFPVALFVEQRRCQIDRIFLFQMSILRFHNEWARFVSSKIWIKLDLLDHDFWK